jgi:hypothetical protein
MPFGEERRHDLHHKISALDDRRVPQAPERHCAIVDRNRDTDVLARLRACQNGFVDFYDLSSAAQGLGCRAARFQIMEIVGDRKRGKEWAEREQLYQAAETVSDVREPYTCSTAVPFDEAAKMVAEALAGKARHYGQVNCAALDALVYIDLRISHLWPPEARNAADTAAELDRQGWRSVSMLSVPYGAVLTANASAPDFLRANIGLVLNAWPGLDDWFDP